MKTVDTAPRVALSNCTNVSWSTINPPDIRPPKRRISTEYDSSKKRPRVEKTAQHGQHYNQIHNGPIEGNITRGSHWNCTTFSALRATRMRPQRYFCSPSEVSSRPVLASFVSSHKSDVYRLNSRDDPIVPGLPFACAFTTDAKRGGPPVLAVATQDGTIELLHVGKRRDWDFEPQRTVIQVHSNAILDTKWRMDDQSLATSSSDSTTRITCVTTQKSLAVLAHHTSSVKSLDWNPDHADLLSTAGRDGSICVWDLRTATQSKATDNASAIAPVVVIPHAHCDARPRGKTAKFVSDFEPSLTERLTQIRLKANDYENGHFGSLPATELATTDFKWFVRRWDLRYPTSGRARRPIMLSESYCDPTLTTSSRARGLSGLALGHNYSSGLIWGIAADSCIHPYTIPLSAPSGGLARHRLSHPGLFVKSFYVRMAISPCGSWLASGSSGGGAYLWDVASRSANQRRAVELKAAGREIGAVDWASDSLAACCDDGSVRVWRPNQEISVACKTNPEENRWKWAWATEE